MNILPAHRHYSQNRHGRDFFIGDVHGKYTLLMQALAKINFDYKADRLFAVGDLIDRGEASFNCLLLSQKSWFIPVLGNHEQFLMETAEGDIYNKFVWYQNGGGWWESLTGRGRELAKNIIEQNYSLTLSVDTLAGKVGVIHAQYPLNRWPIADSDINQDTLHELLWSRDIISNGRQHAIAGIDFLVSGHTPLPAPLLKNKQLFIDTGSGHVSSTLLPEPHLTICEFKKEHIEVYALAKQLYQFSEIEI